MSFRKRGDKYLVTAEFGADELGVRRRVCRTVDTEDEAKRLDAKLQHEIYEGRHIQPSSESVAAFCARYLDDHEAGIAGTTYTRSESILRNHVKKDLGRVPLSRFTPKVAASWKKKMLESGLSPSTVRKQMIFVGAAMELAVSWKLIGENPLRHVELPAEETPPFHVFTPSEQAALLSAAAPSEGDPEGYHVGRSEGSLYVPLVLDLATGLRLGELLALRLNDIDLGRGRLHVRQAMRAKRGGGMEMGPCKTKRSQRTVVLPGSVVGLLAEYKSQRPPTKSDLFFISLRGAPWTTHGFKASWRKVRSRAAGIMVHDAEELHDPFALQAGDGLLGGRFHDLRHTHATELLRAGVHIKVVAERLGDTETTVMKTYSHVLPDMQETAAAAIEPMLRGLLTK